MTAKFQQGHYKALAAALRSAREADIKWYEATKGDHSEMWNKGFRQGASAAHANLEDALAKMFSEDNPKFDYDKFIKAIRGVS